MPGHHHHRRLPLALEKKAGLAVDREEEGSARNALSPGEEPRLGGSQQGRDGFGVVLRIEATEEADALVHRAVAR